jgi:tetratricopeptide (TPR) repeat protein
MAGDIESAISSNKQILALKPSHARAHQELGYAYKISGQALESASHFYQATQINPALFASWKALYEHYQNTGNNTAAQLTKVQLDYLNTLPKAVLSAKDLMYEGQFHKADQLCRRFLQEQKHDPEGMLLLAEIGIALKVYGEAEFLLESCLTLYPEHRAAGIEYLQLLTKMGRFQAAKDWALKLDKAHPNHPAIEVAKASALVGLGEVEQAILLYKKLLNDTPQQAGLYLLLGHAFKAAGQLDEAITAYKKAYAHKADFGDAYWSLANTKTYSFSEQEMQNMHQQSAQDIAEDDKIHFYFALGKALEDKKDYTASFDFYAKGNALKQQQTGYLPASVEQQVAKQIQVFSSELLTKLSNLGHDSSDPIFVVGLPRAGSTLIEQILASHSQVDGTMELHNILGLAAKLNGPRNNYPEIMREIKPEYLARFGQQYIEDTKAYRANAPFFIDKMPNNFMHIGLIKLILPNAKIIDARREPMACCFSGFKQLFAEGQDFTYGLENIAKYYANYVEIMNHWDAVLPGFVLRVQHEDVINDLEGQVKRMLDFCELPFEQNCIDFHKTKRTIKTPSSEQVRQPIFRDSMQQWKHYEEHLTPLKNILAGAQLLK